MGIFTTVKSTAIDSPRHLTLRHARRSVALKKQELNLLGPDELVPELPELQPGQEQLHSYWTPNLVAGPTYDIAVEQTVDAKNGDPPLRLKGNQKFFVDAPQFSLPEGSIYSTYPPAGHSDDHRILPHVVLSDPHLPWERLGGQDASDDRNRIPWLALITFTSKELQLPQSKLDSMFAGTSVQLQKPVKQSPTLAVNMTVDDLWSTTEITTPIKADPNQPKMKDQRGDFVFLSADLFTSLFSTFDSSGTRRVPATPDTTQYKYLSHVRNINTTGMAVAGEEDDGVFSVVVSNRAGPLTNLTATTATVHLLSIEDVTAMKFPITSTYVAMCSLHSWNYTVNPPGMLNVPEAFENLGKTLGVLRAPDILIDPLRKGSKVQARVADRLSDGYTLVKYRTQTGEPTVALMRGPLTPTIVPSWTLNDACSNSGIDLQVLDREVGIMDISYSTAWQLGRLLALGNPAFAAALSRVRAAVHRIAMGNIKIELLKEKSDKDFRTRPEVLQDMVGMVKKLQSIHAHDASTTPDGEHSFIPGGPLKRWHRPQLLPGARPDLSRAGEQVQDKYLEEAINAARSLALATDKTIYDETNTPVNTDWMILLAWVMDRKFLAGVPAHYLLVDPSHLPHESLRFFYIDPKWVDAMVDGGLSLANHQGNDLDRAAIKVALNDFIKSKPELLPHAPQIPSYGFFMRSDLVTMFPDMKVDTWPPQPFPPVRAPLLRHTIVSDGVMLCLLDRLPGEVNTNFNQLSFTQPPHQQRFAAAKKLEAGSIQIDILRQYTVDQSIRTKDPKKNDPVDSINTKPTDPDNVFVWDSNSSDHVSDLRILRLPEFASKQRQLLAAKMGTYQDGGTAKPYFDDDTATSALFGLQLNDPYYRLWIDFSDPDVRNRLSTLAAAKGDSDVPAPRTLALLRPSKVTKVSSSTHPSEPITPDEPDHVALDAAATFQRLSTLSEGFLQPNRAPHVRMAPLNTPSSLATSPSTRSSRVVTVASDPGRPPQITCNAYTRGKSDIHYNGLKQDVVFSINLDNIKNSSFELIEFSIKIRMGAPDPDSATLFGKYDGPGAYMLSNLRYNVLIGYPQEQGDTYMNLRLLPRNERGYNTVTNTRELGFILSLASPNEFKNKKDTLIQLSTTAHYRNGDVKVPDTFFVNIVNDDFV